MKTHRSIQRAAVLLSFITAFVLFAAPGTASNGTTKTYPVSTLTTFESGTGGLTVAPSGTLYHSDFGSQLGGGGTGGNRVFKITPKGEVTLFASDLRGASGSEWGHDGWLYQSNIGSHVLSKISPDGTVETVTQSGLRNPVGVVQLPGDAAKPGDFLVANCGSASVQRVTPDGDSTTWVQSDLLACPNGIAVGDNGNIYTANFSNGNVVQITPAGELSVLVTLPGNNNGHLFYRHGALWVAGRGAHQIFRVALNGDTRGAFSVIAGSGVKGGEDGAGKDATFCFPNDLGFSPDGKVLYVNEVGGECTTSRQLSPTRIRMIHIDV